MGWLRGSLVVVLASVVLVLAVVPSGALAASGAGLRIVAANLTSGRDQLYEGPGRRILKALAPDICLIQEFNAGTGADGIREFVNDTFGPSFSFFREDEAAADIPNGIVSRYPIVAAGEWEMPGGSDRDFCWARIDVPGDRDLWAVSVHLKATKFIEEDPDPTLASQLQRLEQAKELVALVRKNVPEGALLVIGGDFNTSNHGEPCLEKLAEVVVAAGPYPVDGKGNDATNSSRRKPYDRVMVSPALAALEVPVTVGARSFKNGFVCDTRDYEPLSDLAPVQSSDSAELNMQHMGVARSFVLDGAAAAPLTGR